jgi:uncharacterized membrane protein YbjE (DUF340 family)
MEFSWILILTFLLSILVGRRIKVRPKTWIVSIIIISLVFTISLWRGLSMTLGDAFKVFFISLASSLIIIFSTYSIGLIVSRKHDYKTVEKTKYFPTNIIISVIVGITLGIWLNNFNFPVSTLSELINIELVTLISLIGISISRDFDFKKVVKGGSKGIKSTLIAIIGAIISSAIISISFDINMKASLAITFGFGWYTLDGPLVTSAFSPLLGTIAFLANFFREQFTFILVPLLRGSQEALISIGGATTMDDTLVIYIKSFGQEESLAPIVNGFLLTILTPIIVPAIISL